MVFSNEHLHPIMGTQDDAEWHGWKKVHKNIVGGINDFVQHPSVEGFSSGGAYSRHSKTPTLTYLTLCHSNQGSISPVYKSISSTHTLTSCGPMRPPCPTAQVGDEVLHIELRRWADLMVIAPLSANTLAKVIEGKLCRWDSVVPDGALSRVL